MVADVDIVITWVDGSDPRLAAKRAAFAREAPDIIDVEGVDETQITLRWKNHGEINTLLRSIHHFAPWVRTIWIVTDDQTPQLNAPDDVIAKIRIVDHREIFRDYEDCLPTFNSVSIETMLWRIDGLSENFIYFNDDVFLANPVRQSDFFGSNSIVLRGTVTDKIETALLYGIHQKNALNLLSKKRALRNAHVAFAAKKSLLSNFFAENPELMRKNISHRFRHPEQFSPFALLSYLAADAGLARHPVVKDYAVVSAAVAQSGDRAAMQKSLSKIDRPHILLGCINDVGSLMENGIDINNFIERVVSRKALSRTALVKLSRLLPKVRTPIS